MNQATIRTLSQVGELVKEEKHIYISIPGNNTVDKLTLNTAEIRKMLESTAEFEKVSDITSFFGKQFATQAYSYDFTHPLMIRAFEAFIDRLHRLCRIKP